MGAGWVAGSVRAAAMARRRLGVPAIRSLAAGTGLTPALEVLAGSPYGPAVRATDDLAAAQRHAAATTLWNLRVLAGWLPVEGVRMLRLMTARFEITNVADHLFGLTAPSSPGTAPFRLGSLATAWPRLAATTSAAALRAVLAASAWGDPGADSPQAITVWLPLSWAVRVSDRIPAGRPWAAGAAVLVVARELFALDRRLPRAAAAAADRVLGRSWSRAGGVTDLAGRVPAAAAWVLTGIDDPADLWRAEAAWWARLRGDGLTLLRRPGSGPHRPLGAAAALLADSWQVSAALEIAARGGGHREVLDAVA